MMPVFSTTCHVVKRGEEGGGKEEGKKGDLGMT